MSSNTEIVKIKLTNARPNERKLDAPVKIRVSCGGYTATVKARSFTEAFGLFLDKKKPKALGVICEFKTKEWDPIDDTWYMDTVKTLEALGRYE